MSVRNEQELQRAIKAAIEGPDVEGIKFQDHGWNVDKAVVTPSGQLITVDGSSDGDNISHRRSWARDDQIYYKVTVQVNQGHISLQGLDVNINAGGLVATYLPVIKWIIEHWDEIKDIFDGIFGGDNIETTVAQLRSNVGVTQLTDQILDGSWEAEARFLILNIALYATAQNLAAVQPNWLTDFATTGGTIVSDLVTIDSEVASSGTPPGSLIISVEPN